MMDFQKRDVMKALTSLAIQKVLNDISVPAFEKVSKRLQKEYKCYIPDCYDHPEYLESVLKSIFGNAYTAIVEQIRIELVEHLDDNGISMLIKTMAR
jgi:hypothetical protein